jgi:hypothetical protein
MVEPETGPFGAALGPAARLRLTLPDPGREIDRPP